MAPPTPPTTGPQPKTPSPMQGRMYGFTFSKAIRRLKARWAKRSAAKS